MKHYIYDIDNDFKHFVVVAPNQQEAKKVVKEISGSAMCNMTVNSREVAPQEYQRMGKFVKVLGIKSCVDAEQPTAAQPTDEQAAAETETAETEQKAETKNSYEHAVEMAKYAASMGDGVQAIYFKDGNFKAGLESDRQYAEKNGWQYFHTVWETVPEEERTRAEKWEEIKEARKKSMFFARRLSYKSADSHPEWKEKYKSAKHELERAKAENKIF